MAVSSPAASVLVCAVEPLPALSLCSATAVGDCPVGMLPSGVVL